MPLPLFGKESFLSFRIVFLGGGFLIFNSFCEKGEHFFGILFRVSTFVGDRERQYVSNRFPGRQIVCLFLVSREE